MPEGDTVHLAARTLHAALAGARITRSDFRVPSAATIDLRSQTLDAVVARGKHLLLRTDGGVTVHAHFGMDGSWRVQRAPRGPAHEIRAILSTERAMSIAYRLKKLEVLPTANEPDIVGHLGPDPLADDWDLAEAARRMREAAGETITVAVLDQRIVAGFGNVYRNEICFLRGYHPDRLVRDVDIDATLTLGARLLRANREQARHITTGNTRPGMQRWVYGRRGEPCRRCGTPIRKRADNAERVTYWCPHCQES